MSCTGICDIGAVLADRTRVRALEVLGGGPLSVGQLAQVLNVTPPTASYHVGRLLDVDLVVVRQRGRRHVVRRQEHRWRRLMDVLGDV